MRVGQSKRDLAAGPSALPHHPFVKHSSAIAGCIQRAPNLQTGDGSFERGFSTVTEQRVQK
jgi:hypothetical protein